MRAIDTLAHSWSNEAATTGILDDASIQLERRSLFVIIDRRQFDWKQIYQSAGYPHPARVRLASEVAALIDTKGNDLFFNAVLADRFLIHPHRHTSEQRNRVSLPTFLQWWSLGPS